MGMQEDLCGTDLQGRRVRKAFPGYGFFEGKITFFNPVEGFYKVEYEDGDREDMELHEVQQFLLENDPESKVALPVLSCEGPLTFSPTNNYSEDDNPRLPSHPAHAPSPVVSSSDLFAENSESEESPCAAENASHLHWSAASHYLFQRAGKAGAPLVPSSMACCTESLQPDIGRSKRQSIKESMPAKYSVKVKQLKVDEGCVSATGMLQILEGRKEEDESDVFEHVSDTRLMENLAMNAENVMKSSQVVFPGTKSAPPIHGAPLLPHLHHLPPSSGDFKVPQDAVLDFLETYSFLSITKTSGETCERGPSYCRVLLEESIHRGQVNWTFLDAITWPLHLMVFLATYSSRRIRHLNVAPIANIEYYKISIQDKLAILNELCHHVMDTDEIRTELSSREIDDLNEGSRGLEEMLKLDIFQQPEHLVEGEFNKKILEGANEGVVRKNLDECILCGMNGNLLCCDSCPAAYHARCVGVSRVMSLQGDWLCPECVVDGPQRRQLNLLGLRGGNLLGAITYGLTFIMAWGYLLVIESSAGVNVNYYNLKDLPDVLVWLEKIKPFSDPVKNRILLHCSRIGILPRFCALDASHQEHNYESSQTHQQFSFGRDRTSEGFAANDYGGAEGLLALSSSGALVGGFTSDGAVANCNKAMEEIFQHSLTNCLLNSVLVEARDEDCSLQRSNEIYGAHEHCLNYFNCYSLGDVAATAAANLALKIARRRARINPVKEQLAAFCKSFVLFYWPSSNNRLMELSKEKCGWCFCCSHSGTKKGCLLNLASRRRTTGTACISNVVGHLRFESGHLSTVACYLLHIENSLKALLLGPWQDAGFRIQWRRVVQQAEVVNELKIPFLQFESCLRPALLSGKWFNGQDESFTRGAYSADIGLNTGACRKSGQNKSVLTTELESDEAASFLLSWKKRKSPGKFFQTFTLPSHLARQAGRQGGLKEVQGLIYSEEHDLPLRSMRCAWQAKVEASCTVSQLALQVRCLDAHLRWNDLFSDSVSADACKPSNIYAKSWKNNRLIYFVDTKVLKKRRKKKFKAMSTDHQDRVWVPDTQIPLSLLRDFEEKLWLRQKKKDCSETVGSSLLRDCKRLRKGLVLDRKSRSAVVCLEQSTGMGNGHAHKAIRYMSASPLIMANRSNDEAP
ncbi:hypothetical protein GOP47_0005333 [Adiantum capillus-veneris]|uniref:PHD-type domain-containing protein n=1 Tax=Adiantum capillus-veneris TaxID=13818 RepID=A0A9D4ZLH1_ADICA|nr:hypothetical protein GOP47_0005333 [Adiantum capillus-veneris]